MAAICPAAHQPTIIVRRPNDPLFRIATRNTPELRPPSGVTGRAATDCHGALTLTLGRFQPPFSGRSPVSGRYPGKLVVLRALRQELVSRLTVPTIYSVKSVKNVDN
jgi:hypothetical protein